MRAPDPTDLHLPITRFLKPVRSTVRAAHTVAEALAEIRTRGITDHILYFYALDAEEKLAGVVPTRALLLAAPDARIEDIMRRGVATVPDSATLGDALEMFAIHRFLALPVVDQNHRLLGVIDLQLYADETSDLAEAARQADVFQLVGVWAGEYRRGSPLDAYRLRMPWLACNLAGGLVCALIASAFGDVVKQVLVIAAFIPLVLTLNESISIQSLTLSIHRGAGGAGGGRADLIRLVKREGITALLLGLSSGLLVAVAAALWGGGAAAPFVIGGSIAAAMALSAAAGLFVPILLHRLRLDPKIAAGPLVLALVDTVSLTLYLALSTAFLL